MLVFEQASRWIVGLTARDDDQNHPFLPSWAIDCAVESVLTCAPYKHGKQNILDVCWLKLIATYGDLGDQQSVLGCRQRLHRSI